MDTTNYPTIEPGLRTKYRTGRGLGVLEGQVRIVGPLDEHGGAHMLDESGEPMDYMDAEGLADPAIFWTEREPAGSPVHLSPMAFEVSFRATVTLDEPVVVRQSNLDYEVTEVVVAWSNRGRGWSDWATVKGRRILKSGGRSEHLTSIYGMRASDLAREAADASRPVSTPSITWSN